MKRLAVFLAVFIPGILLMGQEESWMEVTAVGTRVSVSMPSLPKYEKKSFYYEQQPLVKEVYSLAYRSMDMFFEHQPQEDESKKAVSRAMKKVTDLLAIRYKGKPVKTASLSREGVDYRYVEIELSNGDITRSVQFAESGRLYHIFTRGSKAMSYGLDANEFLQSWKIGEQPAQFTDAAGIEEDAVQAGDLPDANDAGSPLPPTWQEVKIDDAVTAYFPEKPFRRNTVIEMGRRDIIVTAFSRHADSHALNFVVTRREFGPDEGQLSDDDLYNYMIGQAVKLNRLKLNSSTAARMAGTDCTEYILSKGIRFYKLRIFRIGETVYQAMVKGKRKNINEEVAARFFHSFTSSQ
jgi:hypothetical protein